MGKAQILIIGGSAAGAAAAAKCSRLYPEAQIKLVENGDYVAFGACELPFYLSGRISSIDELQVFTPEKLADKKKIDVFTRTRLLEIDKRKQECHILLADGTEVHWAYDKLILATGSNARSILQPAIRASNLFALKNLADGQAIMRSLRQHTSAKIVILGAGYIALEIATALLPRVAAMALFNRSDLPLPGFANPARRMVLESIQAEDKITYHSYSELEDFSMRDGRLTAIKLDGIWQTADIFIEALGVIPNSAVAGAAGLRINADATIACNRSMQSSNANIFAAGDVTHGWHRLSRRPFYFPLASTARKMGRVAAANLFYARENLPESLGTTALRFLNLEIARTGYNAEQAKTLCNNLREQQLQTTDIASLMPEKQPLYWYLVMQRHPQRLLGATLAGSIGAAARINVLALAISEKIDLGQLRRTDFLYAPEYSPLIDGFELIDADK
jgi:NADPH-dependent 2,4-dienoyl-CoA reductase/sulfur reductase-like enzyme